MRNWRTISLGREIAAAFAVFAMLLQVMFAPAVLERHTLSVETDYGLTLICGSAADHAAADPSSPASDHHVHDCPCCFATAGVAVLPESSAVTAPEALPAISRSARWSQAQVLGTINLAGRQQPRAPPSVV